MLFSPFNAIRNDTHAPLPCYTPFILNRVRAPLVYGLHTQKLRTPTSAMP